MNDAKIKLSEDELQLAHDAGIILTKNAIIQTAINLFAALAENLRVELEKTKLSEEVRYSSPKISKGENYKCLPYVMLDYPKLFSHENIFAIRTMFWWGNYFSTTLHLKGIYKERFQEPINKNFSLLQEKNFSVSLSTDEWVHEHEDNYVSLSRITENEFADILRNKIFLKISAKTELSYWNNAEAILTELFKTILQSV